MKKMYLVSLTLILISFHGFSQLVWEVSTVISPVSSYRGGSAHYFDGNQDFMYVFGGWGTTSGNFNETSIYNISDDTWSAGPEIPENTKGGSAVGIGDDLYLLIGNNGDDGSINSQIFLKYNVVAETWDYMAEYPLPARYVSLAFNTVNGFIYGAGGLDNDYEEVAEVCAYDIENNTWTECDSLFTASSGGSVMIYEGHHLYHVGGLIGSPVNKLIKGLIDPEDPFSIKWNYASSIPVEMGKVSAGYLGNGKIIATEREGTFAYDISTDIWNDMENKPTPVKGGNGLSVNIDNAFRFIVAGGKDLDDNYVDHAEYVQSETNFLYAATFVLTNSYGTPVPNATIEVAEYTLHTDYAGAAVQYLENGTYDYYATYENLEVSGTFVIENTGEYISAELVVSIEENANNFNIYPNPCSGIFKLQGAANTTIEVYDLKGRLIFIKSDIENNCSIDLSENETGLYFVKIIQDNGSVSINKIVLE